MIKPELNEDFFRGNRQRLMEQLPAGAVAIIPAHTAVQRNGDVTYPFRQDSNFFYLTGLETPDCLLVLAPDLNRELLIIPDKNKLIALWEGQESKSQLSKISGLTNIIEHQDSSRMLRVIMSKARAIYFPFVPKKLHFPLAFNPAREKHLLWLKKHWPSKKIKDILPMLAQLRMLKQSVELDCIKQAIAITGNGLDRAKRILRTGISEYQLSAAIEFEFNKAGSQSAWPSIVATGENACTIHYTKNNGVVLSNDLVLFDVGAEYLNYAADISRTVSVNGFTRRQRAVYEAVQDVQRFAMELLKPGMLFRDYEAEVAKYMGGQLVKLGLIKKPTTAGIRKYFPQATSHFLGLDAHDAGDYYTDFKPGMVLTVEPGIYIPAEGIGVRIEDDVLITEHGVENLSAGIGLG